MGQGEVGCGLGTGWGLEGPRFGSALDGFGGSCWMVNLCRGEGLLAAVCVGMELGGYAASLRRGGVYQPEFPTERGVADPRP